MAQLGWRVPEELKRRAEIAAAKAGVSKGEWIAEAIREKLARSTK